MGQALPGLRVLEKREKVNHTPACDVPCGPGRPPAVTAGVCSRKKLCLTPAKDGQAALIQRGQLQRGFVVVERDWTQLCLQQGLVGICSEGEEWGSMVGKS